MRTLQGERTLGASSMERQSSGDKREALSTTFSADKGEIVWVSDFDMKKLVLSARFGLMIVLAGSCAIAATEATNTAIIPAPRDDKWMARHEGFLAEARQINPDVVFLGDSIT